LKAGQWARVGGRASGGIACRTHVLPYGSEVDLSGGARDHPERSENGCLLAHSAVSRNRSAHGAEIAPPATQNIDPDPRCRAIGFGCAACNADTVIAPENGRSVCRSADPGEVPMGRALLTQVVPWSDVVMRVRHATSATLQEIQPLLEELRSMPGLVEKTPGASSTVSQRPSCTSTRTRRVCTQACDSGWSSSA
jgi:hypothetical protein